MDKKKINIELGRPLTYWDGLQLLFIGLKLAGAIDWRWFLVFAPTWITILGLAILSVIITTMNYFQKTDEES